ncbi:MAG: PEPxxWA-CTERM sorting domain-containing protein [Pontixanthobacter sp.]
MTKLALLGAIAAPLLLATPAHAATFFVSQSGNGVSANGTITTDDTVGSLAEGNITDFQLDLDDGTGVFTLNGFANAGISISGSGLTATATGLFFDFSGSGFALFQNPGPGSGINFLCFAGNSVCGGDTNRTSISVDNFGGGFAQEGVQQVGFLEVGSAVPEPSTWAMLLLGFFFAGGALRAAGRKQTATLSYS